MLTFHKETEQICLSPYELRSFLQLHQEKATLLEADLIQDEKCSRLKDTSDLRTGLLKFDQNTLKSGIYSLEKTNEFHIHPQDIPLLKNADAVFLGNPKYIYWYDLYDEIGFNQACFIYSVELSEDNTKIRFHVLDPQLIVQADPENLLEKVVRWSWRIVFMPIDLVFDIITLPVQGAYIGLTYMTLGHGLPPYLNLRSAQLLQCYGSNGQRRSPNPDKKMYIVPLIPRVGFQSHNVL